MLSPLTLKAKCSPEPESIVFGTVIGSGSSIASIGCPAAIVPTREISVMGLSVFETLTERYVPELREIRDFSSNRAK